MCGTVIGRDVGNLGELDSASRDLELGDFAAWIERPMGKTVCAADARPVIGNEDCVGPNCLDHHRANGKIISPSRDGYPIAIFNIVLLCEARMNFSAWLWVLVDQGADAARLRP